MEVAAVSLDAVTVRARAPQRGVERPTPGSTERNLAPEVIARLPIDASDLNTLATLAPGVVGIGETDSTSAAFSVAGQRSTANNITLDGLSFGSGNVPQDALRTTRVVTSTYDVARGQFSGGLVASTTRSGTNVPQGSFTYGLHDRDLAWGGVTESPFDQGYTQNQLSGGMGGPIVPNRLFVFGSLQGRWRGQALPSLVSADPPSLERLGVSPDSAARFLALAGATGVPMTVPALPGDRATDNSVALLRLDWNLSDAQTVMLRLDSRWSSQDPTRVSPLALPATGGTRAQRAGGAMASLSSHFGEGFINEVRGYVSTDRSDATGFLELPAGRVQVGSSLSGAGVGGWRRPVSPARRRTTPLSTRCAASAPTGSRASDTHRPGAASRGPPAAGGTARGCSASRPGRSCAAAWETSAASRRARSTPPPSRRLACRTPRPSSCASAQRSRHPIGRSTRKIRPPFRRSASTRPRRSRSRHTPTPRCSTLSTPRRTRGAPRSAFSDGCEAPTPSP